MHISIGNGLPVVFRCVVLAMKRDGSHLATVDKLATKKFDNDTHKISHLSFLFALYSNQSYNSKELYGIF
jgi:hypothetical protein